jgi:hypothetical protein
MSIKGVPAAVVPPGSSRISMASCILHVFKRYTCLSRAGDERYAQ